jgi:ribosome-associated protein
LFNKTKSLKSAVSPAGVQLQRSCQLQQRQLLLQRKLSAITVIMEDMQPDQPELNPPEDDHGYDGPSRSQLRREALDVLKLAHTLVDLSDAQLAHVPLTDDLREEILRARAVKQQIARKRQTQFVAKQLRKVDEDAIEAIRAALEHDKDFGRRETALLHQVEKWRERLIAEGDGALNEFLGKFPQADRQQLRQISRQARNERDQNKPLQAYRELFRILREISSSA